MQDRNTLKYWEPVAKHAIVQYLKQKRNQRFTSFLYEFANSCSVALGVMVDYNDHTEKIFLVDEYYTWMHKLKDEIAPLHKRTVFRHQKKVKAVA